MAQRYVTGVNDVSQTWKIYTFRDLLAILRNLGIAQS